MLLHMHHHIWFNIWSQSASSVWWWTAVFGVGSFVRNTASSKTNRTLFLMCFDLFDYKQYVETDWAAFLVREGLLLLWKCGENIAGWCDMRISNATWCGVKRRIFMCDDSSVGCDRHRVFRWELFTQLHVFWYSVNDGWSDAMLWKSM